MLWCSFKDERHRYIDSKNSRVRRDHRDVLIQHLYFTGEEAEDQRKQIIPRVKKPVSGKGRHHVSMACLAASMCLWRAAVGDEPLGFWLIATCAEPFVHCRWLGPDLICSIFSRELKAVWNNLTLGAQILYWVQSHYFAITHIFRVCSKYLRLE